MAITVKDIHEKEFTRQVRGYSIDEVDDFLDEIAQQMELLIRENRALNIKLSEKPPVLEAQAAPAAVAPVAPPAPVVVAPAKPAPAAPAAKDDTAYFRNLETTLRDTLVSAQRVAEETMSEAQKKAEKLVSSAEEQAGSILSGAKTEAAKVRAENEELHRAAEAYRSSLCRISATSRFSRSFSPSSAVQWSKSPRVTAASHSGTPTTHR